jgi:hypothetical protein
LPGKVAEILGWNDWHSPVWPTQNS